MAEATNSTTSAASNGRAAHYSQSVPTPEPGYGVRCSRFFSKPGISPYSEVAWERRTASITDATGINDSGEILCDATKSGGSTHAVLLTPK